MKTEHRQRLLIFAACVAVGLLLGDKLIFTPLGKLWQKRSERIQLLRKDVTRGDSLVKRETFLEGRWRDMRATSLPKDRAEAEDAVISRVDDWSRRARATITSIVPQWRNNEEDHTRLECRIEGYTDMEGLARMLYEINGSTLPLRVDSIEISTRDAKGRQLGFDLRFSAVEIRTDMAAKEVL